jgi:hypothetical protein
MKNVLLGFAVLLSSPAYAREVQAYSVVHKVITFRVTLMTKEGRHLTDTVTAESENDARNIIRERYPNCIIYGVYPIR